VVGPLRSVSCASVVQAQRHVRGRVRKEPGRCPASDADCRCEVDRQQRSRDAETTNGTDMKPQLLAPDSGHYEVASDRGGERAATTYSLIETAKLNGLDPEAYLRDVLARIADHPINRIAELLPWVWKPTHQIDRAA